MLSSSTHVPGALVDRVRTVLGTGYLGALQSGTWLISFLLPLPTLYVPSTTDLLCMHCRAQSSPAHISCYYVPPLLHHLLPMCSPSPRRPCCYSLNRTLMPTSIMETTLARPLSAIRPVVVMGRGKARERGYRAKTTDRVHIAIVSAHRLGH